MVKYEHIIKAINDYVKCKATAKIRKIGDSAQNTYEESVWFDEKYLSQITYDDGTTLTFDEDGNITHITTGDGFDKDYLFYDSNYFFDKQRDILIEKYGPEKYELFGKYAHYWATWRGQLINQYLRGEINKTTLKKLFKKNGFIEEYEFMMDNYNDFVEMCRNNNLAVYGNFYTVRVVDHIHDNTKLEKRIISDKGHYSTSAGGDMRSLKDSFAKTKKPWTVITLYEQDNPACYGAFFGEVVNYYTQGFDWEMEIHHTPGQQFRRTLIDKKNKVIIQKPYKKA